MRRVIRESFLKEEGPKSAPRISRGLIEEMLAAVSIVDLLEGEYGFILMPQGKGFVTHCPMPDHKDNNPSCSVDPERNTFKCWACGTGGDALTLLMRVDGMNFPQALERLSVLSGIGTDEGEGGMNRALRDIRHVVDEYINRQSSTQLPGGIAEPAFLLMLARRLWEFQEKTNFDPVEIDWCESVYRSIDDFCLSGNQKKMKEIWSKVGKELPIRLKNYREANNG